MKAVLYYCAFYGDKTKGLPGQQNLSRPVRKVISDAFSVVDLSPQVDQIVRFPNLLRVIHAMHRTLVRRVLSRRTGQVTVVDMVHSFTALPASHANDRLIVLGHDSYALRTLRELQEADDVRSKLRLATSWLGWSYVEFLLNLLAWRCLFASPVDLRNTIASSHSDWVAIPVSEELRAAGKRRHAEEGPQNKSKALRLLVSMPVVNRTQNNIDREIFSQMIKVIDEQDCITLWGAGATQVAEILPDNHSNLFVVDWVEDYAGFLGSFDLMIYPRIIGSGFHTKIAEALVLGIPCICVDWVAEPLREAGYEGLRSFSNSNTFADELISALTALRKPSGLPRPAIPEKAAPEAALAALVAACAQGLNAR